MHQDKMCESDVSKVAEIAKYLNNICRYMQKANPIFHHKLIFKGCMIASSPVQVTLPVQVFMHQICCGQLRGGTFCQHLSE
jgi:hypothetical protein